MQHATRPVVQWDDSLKQSVERGGEWVLLAGWLGWYYTEVGKYDQAKGMLEWMNKQADINGQLPEQVATNLNDPKKLNLGQR